MILDMKRIKHNRLLVILLGIFLLLGACKKDTKLEETWDGILDANVSFTVKPESGTDFFLHLYHTKEEDEPFYQRDPDIVLRRNLSESDIEDGFTLPLEALDRSGFAYVTAFVDLDGDGEVSEGDIATGYYEHNLRAVMHGREKASNVAHREFLTIEMAEIYTTLVSYQATFKFPFSIVEETVLALNLYYGDAAEPRFFEREPDAVVTRELTQADITAGRSEAGLTITLDDIEDSEYVYTVAYLDIDGNGELNHGDIAVGYDDKPFNEFIDGTATAGNMAGEDKTVWTMNKWFVDNQAPAKDVDGNTYTTVIIGNKEWMVENLKTTRYRTGEPIVTGLSDAAWADTYNSGQLGAYAVYPFADAPGVDSEEQMIAEYGLLYNGFAVQNSRGLAPVGWRVATDDDFKELELAIGFTQEQADATGWRGDGVLKLRSTTGWPINNGTDDFGFKAIPAGGRAATGAFSHFNVRANFWTSTVNAPTPLTQSYRRIIEDARAQNIQRGIVANREGFSVRCVRDVSGNGD